MTTISEHSRSYECSSSSAQPQLGALAVLGSTGSIGSQTLQIVRDNPGIFRVASLAANTNVERIISQAREFKPELIAMSDLQAGKEVQQALGNEYRVVCGEHACCEAGTLDSVHTVVAGVVGFAGLEPVLSAIEHGKHIALANKECLAAAGPLLNARLSKSSSCMVPVDSEHNSIFQCMFRRGIDHQVRRIILTASGGPFLNYEKKDLEMVSSAQAVQHPRWKMGAKISVDSATLMNKGLEVIEASMLFGLCADKVEVLIHPQSQVHGMVEYEEGTVLAALFETDMRVPIAFALEYLRSENPSQSPGSGSLRSGVPFLDLARVGKLEFFTPDLDRFPALSLCYQALELGGTMPTVLNAANEIAVQGFLNDQIMFMEIPKLVSAVMQKHLRKNPETIADIIEADAWARDCASNLIVELFRAQCPRPGRLGSNA